MDFCRWGAWAQVAEWLMAADCKSAAPWSYGGSNPPLCTITTVVRDQLSGVRTNAGDCGGLRTVMRSELENEARLDRDSVEMADRDQAKRSGSDLEKRYPLALLLYAVLAALVWFTMDAGKILIHGKPVDLRLVPLIVIGGLALRTVVALQADKIRRSSEKGGGS